MPKRRQILKWGCFSLLGAGATIVASTAFAQRKYIAPLLLFARKCWVAKMRNRILYSQVIQWQGKEYPVVPLTQFSMDSSQKRRAQGWYLASQRTLADRERLNRHWKKQFVLNLEFPKKPEASQQTILAIKKATIPAMNRIYRRWQGQLKVDRLRPWDISASPVYLPFIAISPDARSLPVPFSNGAELVSVTAKLLSQIAPEFGQQTEQMMVDGRIKLKVNKRGVDPLASYNSLTKSADMIVTGHHLEILILAHELTHAIHHRLWDTSPPRTFQETLALAMQLIAGRHLEVIYSTKTEAHRARVQHLESMLELLIWEVVVAEFEFWLYEHPSEAIDPSNCDRKWTQLYKEYFPAIDWSGSEDVLETGWQRFHFVAHDFPHAAGSYALAILGALQIWQNSLEDYPGTVERLQQSMQINKKPLPALFEATGVQLSFDETTISDAVGALEGRIGGLLL